MKTKYYILGVLTALCLLGTGYYAWTLYDAYRKQVSEWNEGAKAAFEEALWLEVNKRAEIPFYSSSSEGNGMMTLNERIPDSVSVMTGEGFRKYKIDRTKYNNSLIKETMRRGDLGALLEMYPLSIDSLSSHWDNFLSEKQLPVRNQLRYVYTDLELQNDTMYSIADKQLSGLDSLTVKYLGFRCEHELVAFVSFPYWMNGFNSSDWCILLSPWFLLVLLFVFYPKLETLAKGKLTYKEVIEKTIEIEKEIIIEKKIHVADVAIDKAQVYELPGGGLFDSFSGTVTKGDFVHKFPPQSALLLRLFLRTKNHLLSTAEIEQELWNGNGSTDKIHKVIQRLRVELKKVSPDLVIKNINGKYELK